MISTTARFRQPQRFFGLRGVVRYMLWPEAADATRARRQACTETDGALQSERVPAPSDPFALVRPPSFDDYVRERLGIAVRKAWALLKIEKAALRSADFYRAYRDGRLSWVRALALLPVLDRTTAPARIARAESVTVRRLSDEVERVLASRDALGSGASLARPPVDSPLPAPIPVTPPNQCRDLSPHARLQIRAREEHAAMPAAAERRKAPEVADAEIQLNGPASVVTLLRDVLDAFADPEEPRWTALERLLRHVITHWESSPRHHHPVFDRDGWRCTVPACSSRPKSPRPPHPLPLPWRRQSARQPHDRLRGSSSPRPPRRYDPRVRGDRLCQPDDLDLRAQTT